MVDSFKLNESVPHVQGIPGPNSMLQGGDIIVIYGANEDLQKFAMGKSE